MLLCLEALSRLSAGYKVARVDGKQVVMQPQPYALQCMQLWVFSPLQQ